MISSSEDYKFIVIVANFAWSRIAAIEVMAKTPQEAKARVLKKPKERVVSVYRDGEFDPETFGTEYEHWVTRADEGDNRLRMYERFNSLDSAVEAFRIANLSPTCAYVLADAETREAYDVSEKKPKDKPEYLVRAFDYEGRLMFEEGADTEQGGWEKTRVLVGRHVRFPVKAYKMTECGYVVIFVTSGQIL